MRELNGPVRRLVVFDVDGTLTRTNAIDARCYARALADHLGAPVGADWDRYRVVTDTGIASEAIERHHRRPARPDEIDAVRDRFLAFLLDAPEPVSEVPGAAALLRHLRMRSDAAVAIATGCWRESAAHKLGRAGIAWAGVPIATADDAASRDEILRLAISRAGGPFARVTYVGDGPWDLRAARALGIGFLGIACEGPAERLQALGAPTVLRDFSDPGAFLAAAGMTS